MGVNLAIINVAFYLKLLLGKSKGICMRVNLGIKMLSSDKFYKSTAVQIPQEL